ncbi:hypothetical protein D9615_004089 [Tricholomella constricta]|uniref:DNA 3'-5' helicase n=1 Tax=Tricholomella constricta TaxID=117010 RepID=A0A8H5HCT6_9AGAR|nr:hypothetical protein D9615_004089 [Tricholomella constricta]
MQRQRHNFTYCIQGEKWDSLTRNWRDHAQTLSKIHLFLIDEVHILHESRGSTLEVVVSRMKTRGSSIRFVLVSATVPNIHDIASWIGSSQMPHIPAKVFEFGEEFRPCKLTRFVIGVHRQRGQNDFVFTKNLDYKLFAALQQHSVGKPILVFCSTRKGVFATAEQLLKEYAEAEKGKKALPWSHPGRVEQSFHDKRLTDFAAFGIGVHHAGLTLDDRRATEDLYLNGVLRIVVATSTLAVGVNLPAHMVVIKGVQTFQNNASIEYSDLDVMQMLGRAGRPQFDKDGIALIFCEEELENKYRALVQGKTIIESSLHANLSEHLNSEIGLGTITSISTAKEWLRGTFLFQRIRKNPKHYALGKDDGQTWEERVDDLVMQSIEKLRQTQLVETPTCSSRDEELIATDYGDIMSKSAIRFHLLQSIILYVPKMSLILALPDRPTLRELLEMISSSEELSDTKLRASEKSALNKLRKHPDIRFEIKRLEKTSDKVFLLIQAVLGGISLNTAEYKSADSHPQLEAFGIFRHVSRIARAIVEVGVFKRLGSQVKYGLELVRCLTAKAWEDRPVVLRQLEQIGEKSIKVLAEHGISSIAQLLKQDALRIDTLLNRRAPFGLELLASVREMPQYFLKVSELNVSSNGGKDPVEIDLSVECGLLEQQDGQMSSKAKKQKGRAFNMTVVLTMSSDMELFDYRRISTKSLKEKKIFTVTVELTRPSQSITVLITSVRGFIAKEKRQTQITNSTQETIAGLVATKAYRPSLSPKEFPMPNTRPLTTTDMDLAGLEDDPGFWDMDVDEKGDDVKQVRDLTKPKDGEDLTPSRHYKSGKILQNLDHAEALPRRLPNGNLPCNHPCKDKNKCRHLCCRDGLPDKPKKRGAIGKPSTEPPKQPEPTAAAPTKHKDSIRKTIDRRLDQLESLHERSSVTRNLKLSPGHRLKLDSPTELRRKRKAIPDFDVQFTELKDPQTSKARGYDATYIDDDDDLPEALDILKSLPTPTRPRTSPSETDYSNSDIDSLIRAVPLDDIEGIPAPRSSSEKLNRADNNFMKLTPSPDRKRNRPSGSVSPSKKRRRYELPNEEENAVKAQRIDVCFDLSSNDFVLKHSKLSTINASQGNVRFEEPYLFIPDTSDEPYSTPDTQQKAVDSHRGTCSLSLDSDYLDFGPATPDLTISSSTISELEKKTPPNMKTFPNTPKELNEAAGWTNNEDEFEELDAWLNSAAVEIL